MTYILYAKDAHSGEVTPIDVPIEGTLEDLYKELDKPASIYFQGQRLSTMDTSLADLGLCPESLVDYSNYITVEEFKKRFGEFIIQNLDRIGERGKYNENELITWDVIRSIPQEYKASHGAVYGFVAVRPDNVVFNPPVTEPPQWRNVYANGPLSPIYHKFNIPWQQIKNYQPTENIRYEWSMLSQYGIIDENILEENPDLPWDMGFICKNTGVSWEYMAKRIKGLPCEGSYWKYILRNPFTLYKQRMCGLTN